MAHSGGQALVAVIGLVVAGCGLGMFIEAVLRRFERQLERDDIPQGLRSWVIGVGLSGAFRTLAETAAGPWLLAIVAVGFIAFGLYAAATARWIKT